MAASCIMYWTSPLLTHGSAMFGCLGSMFHLRGCYQFPGCLTDHFNSFTHTAVSAETAGAIPAPVSVLPWQHDGMTHLFTLKMSSQEKRWWLPWPKETKGFRNEEELLFVSWSRQEMLRKSGQNGRAFAPADLLWFLLGQDDTPKGGFLCFFGSQKNLKVSNYVIIYTNVGSGSDLWYQLKTIKKGSW